MYMWVGCVYFDWKEKGKKESEKGSLVWKPWRETLLDIQDLYTCSLILCIKLYVWCVFVFWL